MHVLGRIAIIQGIFGDREGARTSIRIGVAGKLANDLYLQIGVFVRLEIVFLDAAEPALRGIASTQGISESNAHSKNSQRS